MRNMNQQETLGLESLGIEKPLGKNAKRKTRAKAKLEEQEPVPPYLFTGALNQRDTIEEARRPPMIPSYRSLPIPPLANLTYRWTGQPALSFDPNTDRATPNAASYRYPQAHLSSGAHGATYQPGQGLTPVNGLSPLTYPPRTQTVQTVNPFAGPGSAASVPQKKSGVRPIIRKSPLSVVSYHGLSSFRINKQYRHPKTCLPSESTSDLLGRWTGSLPTTFRRSVSQPLQQSHSKTAESAPPVIHNFRPLTKDGLIHLPAPLPTPTYLRLAHATPSLLPSPQQLLLVLDLNGTLLYRSGHIQYLPRPCLKRFLSYALANHAVLIWSSATSKNLKGMCERLFNPVQRQLLLGEWARDTLDLTQTQYKERVQVYKRLDRVWADEAFQHAHPGFKNGERWGQHNTLLIDDSIMKASAQPFNHVEVPEFVQGAKEGDKAVLEQVVGYLEYARWWNNVSGFVKEMKFGVHEGWGWDWAKGGAPKPEGTTDDEDDDDDGGVKL